MARTTRIVSFEDARSTSRRGNAARRGEQSSARRSPTFSASSEASRSSAKRESRPASASATASVTSARRNRSQSTAASRGSLPVSRKRSRASAETIRPNSEERRSRSRSRDAEADSEEQREERQERQTSSRERRRRERSKARAEKMFDRQFADAPSDASAEGAPRAALYEGKMGSKHRKSSRMQRDASPSRPSGAKTAASSLLANASVSPRSLRIGTAVLCLILACAFLYAPAQQCYQAQRERDRLAVEYSSIEERNDALDVQNDALASDAGMEDAVREKYGYVKNGEETAVVTGLSDEATDTSRDSDNIEANVLSSSVKAPEEWYTPLLDALFGVE